MLSTHHVLPAVSLLVCVHLSSTSSSPRPCPGPFLGPDAWRCPNVAVAAMRRDRRQRGEKSSMIPLAHLMLRGGQGGGNQQAGDVFEFDEAIIDAEATAASGEERQGRQVENEHASEAVSGDMEGIRGEHLISGEERVRELASQLQSEYLRRNQTTAEDDDIDTLSISTDDERVSRSPVLAHILYGCDAF